ncbi:Lipoprotein [Chryseobacterium sp. IT-36CA2]
MVDNMKYIALFSFFLLCSCSKGVNYNFKETEFKTNQLEQKFIVKNKSESDYAFYSFYSTGIEDPVIGANFITITDQNNNKVSARAIYINSEGLNINKKDSLLMDENKKKGFEKNIFWYSENRSIKRNAVFVQSGKEKIFDRGFALLKDQLKNGNSFFLLKKNEKYFIQIEVDFDSTIIKDYLTPFDLDSLKRNHIKIFHGKLTTDKIPLIVK